MSAESLGLTLDQYETVQRYIYSMAFISAWFHRHGDRARRDAAAQAAATLLSAVGLGSPERVFAMVLNHERYGDAYSTLMELGGGQASVAPLCS